MPKLKHRLITEKEFFDYEVTASWKLFLWVPSFMGKLVVKYFLWKTRRKYRRYLWSIEGLKSRVSRPVFRRQRYLMEAGRRAIDGNTSETHPLYW